jgi:hypothetical protein
MNAQFTEADLAQRRSASRRMAWLIGTAVLALYIIGFFFKRG